MIAGILPRIAVVDDEARFCDLLESGLIREGFDVRTAPSGLSALTLIRSWDPEAIVLDATARVTDGFSVLAVVRSFSQAPILLAKLDEARRDARFNAGADDYVNEPIEAGRLAARLRCALQRPPREAAQLRYADLILDVELRTAWRGTREIVLSKREFELVAALLRPPRRVFTRDELLDLVWGVGRNVMRGTVDTYVSYLRTKIDAPPAQPLIHTIRGVGYVIRQMR
jgi:two-component system OmpR family response regulator